MVAALNFLNFAIAASLCVLGMNARSQPWVALSSTAQQSAPNSYTHVSVTLRFDAVKQDVLAGIADEYVRGATPGGTLGAFNAYVTATGLEQLKAHSGVKCIEPIPEDSLLYYPGDEVRKIAAEINRAGTAIATVMPARAAHRTGNATPAEKLALISSLHHEHFVAYQLDGAISKLPSPVSGSPAINLEMKIEGLYELVNRKDIRAIHLLNRSTGGLDFDLSPHAVMLDPQVIETAQKEGSALLSLSLQAYPG